MICGDGPSSKVVLTSCSVICSGSRARIRSSTAVSTAGADITVALGPPPGPGSIQPLLSDALCGCVAQPASQRTAQPTSPAATARWARFVTAPGAPPRHALRKRLVASTSAVGRVSHSISLASMSTVTQPLTVRNGWLTQAGASSQNPLAVSPYRAPWGANKPHLDVTGSKPLL